MAVTPLPSEKVWPDYGAEREEEVYVQCFVDVEAHTQNSQNPQNVGWENILPLDDVGVLPSLNPQFLPSVLQDYALACSEHYQTAFEMPLFCALACLATTVQGKYQVELKQGYIEPLNLYILITAEPSELKSPTLKRFKRPLEQWEEEQHAKKKECIQEAISTNKTIEKLIEGKRAKATRIKDTSELQSLSQEIILLEQELATVPHYTRLFADDVTPESLGAILENQGGRLTIAEAEGGFFATLAGRYAKGVPNLDLILKAYNGENVRIDRKGHKPIFIKNPCLTLLFLIQPYLLKNRDNSEAFQGRGLDARFLYIIPNSKVGYRAFNTSPINESYAQKYESLIHHFLNISPPDNQPYTLTMTAEALKIYAQFMDKIEVAMREGNELAHMRDWAGKKGTLARIVGLLHCANHYQPQNELIQHDTVNDACNIMLFLIAHAKRAYGFMFDDEELQVAKKILLWIGNTGQNVFSARECFQRVKGRIKKQEEVNKALLILEEHNYIKKLPLPIQKTPGRPTSIKYAVNPQCMGDAHVPY